MEETPRPLTDIIREAQAPQRKREREPVVRTWAASLVAIVVALIIDSAVIYSGWTVVKVLSLSATILGFFGIVGFGFTGLSAWHDLYDLAPELPLRNARRVLHPALAGFMFALLATVCQLVAVILA